MRIVAGAVVGLLLEGGVGCLGQRIMFGAETYFLTLSITAPEKSILPTL